MKIYRGICLGKFMYNDNMKFFLLYEYDRNRERIKCIIKPKSTIKIKFEITNIETCKILFWNGAARNIGNKEKGKI